MSDSQQTNLSSGSKKHTRNNSYGRTPLARRSTKGPLDLNDPPAPPTPGRISTEASSIPLPDTAFSPEKPTHNEPPPPLLPPSSPQKDFSYLLRPENFNPLTLKDIPPPFHNAPSHHRHLASTSAHTLTTTPSPPPAQIFSLLYTRLASLTLLNLTPLAAQESKILEDIHSPFYRSPTTGSCILPWELRILVVRLQAIAFGDLRRGVVGFYDLARDARAEARKAANGQERGLWRERLKDLGVSVGNALIEMGDLGSARRHFETLRNSGADDQEIRILETRLALLCLKIGDVRAARRYAEAEEGKAGTMEPLLSMADGRYGDAVQQWRSLVDKEHDVLARQNMAVCALYLGRLDETTEILTGMIEEGHDFHALTFNLATVYELCTERSRAKKMELAVKVAGGMREGAEEEEEGEKRRAERGNWDFKL